jgi:hypothetical protein
MAASFLSDYSAVFGVMKDFIVPALGVATGAYSVWRMVRTRLNDTDAAIAGFQAQIAVLEMKNHKLADDLADKEEKLAAATRELEKRSIKASVEQAGREERAGNFEQAAQILKDCFERERTALSHLAGGLGDWYGGFIGDPGADAARWMAQRHFALALLAEPENARWREAAAELKAAGLVSDLEAGKVPVYMTDQFAFSGATEKPEDAEGLVGALNDRLRSLVAEGANQVGLVLAQRAQRVAQRMLKPGHEATLKAQFQMARSLYYVGLVTEALTSAEAALEAQKKALGDQHPDTLATAALVEAIRTGVRPDKQT